jgi:hypothetical protein
MHDPDLDIGIAGEQTTDEFAFLRELVEGRHDGSWHACFPLGSQDLNEATACGE